MEHAPHPIRAKRRKRVGHKEPDRKSKDQLLGEFYILNDMFKIGGEEEKVVPYQDVLDVVTLKDDADYNDLCEEILQELTLEKEKVLAMKREKDVYREKNDQELLQTINQILSEAQ